MYLTRIFLNSDSRLVQLDRRDPEGLHKTVMRAFPATVGEAPRQQLSVLHRLDELSDGRLVLLVQSTIPPAVERWASGYLMNAAPNARGTEIAGNPAVRRLDLERAGIREGDKFVFRLRANVTKKVDTKSGPDGSRRNGRRVTLANDTERMSWLRRHAEAAGFDVEMSKTRITIAPVSTGRGHGAVTLSGVVFDGHLAVRDPTLFVGALGAGIGPAKAYGFGLLSIARST